MHNSNISVKVVERAGERIQDILHKSDPWEDRDCEREDCVACKTASENDKVKLKNCTKRSVIYMTWCQSCRENKLQSSEAGGVIEKIENRENKRKNEMENEDFIYIGETARSVMEMGKEHFKDLEFLRSKSHMLKHIALYHKDERPDDIKFQIKPLSHHKSAFERQITEAVLIKKNGGQKLMNSKKEYNRCYIPEIVVKKSQNEAEKDPKIEAEESALEIIQKLRPIGRKDQEKGLKIVKKNRKKMPPKDPQYGLN